MENQSATTEFLPYIISWNLTTRCNLLCKHCYIDASKAMPGELTTGEALQVLDEIAEVNHETLLILTGGEPLLRPDLEELVGRASSLGMMAVLGTNGTLLTEERARLLAEKGLAGVGISIDSLLPARHEAFRCVDGSWIAAINGIQAAQKAGLDVQVQITLTRENVDELSEVKQFTKDLGAKILTVFFLVCTGRGQDIVDLGPEEYEEILGKLANEPGDGIMIRPRCAPTFRRVLTQLDPDSLLLKSDAGRCMAAKNYCRITPDGNVTPCPYMPLATGNLREKSFGEIWWSAPLLQELREPELKGSCGECEYQETCGGCRARAFAETGDHLDEDPWCTYEPGTDKIPESETDAVNVIWTTEAEEGIKKVPFFVRKVVRSAVEGMARKQGVSVITRDFMASARQAVGRK
ncbi:MAG: radical SAM protein [Planctomycetota bacterium]|jgi:radical SAM protein with 4Fe4S-binding SPASM domain|nr:radical SAM protein [Planctomycetota bacterium]